MRESPGPPHCGIPATGTQKDAAHSGQILEWVGIFGYHQTRSRGAAGAKAREYRVMAARGFAFLLLGLLAGGCVQSTLEMSSDANLTPRDKKLLASAPYEKATIPQPYQRHIVSYHRKETAGAIVVDSDARYLYYVLEGGKAIRYGITVGEDALAFSGIAKVGRKEEWPSWTPTNDIKKRLGNIPAYVAPGPHNPMGSRALYVYDGPKDTLYRIHGTNQPEYIGSAISSGCIRLTNEDAIDLFNRVKIGSPVVVLAPGQGDSPSNPRVAFTGGRDVN